MVGGSGGANRLARLLEPLNQLDDLGILLLGKRRAVLLEECHSTRDRGIVLCLACGDRGDVRRQLSGYSEQSWMALSLFTRHHVLHPRVRTPVPPRACPPAATPRLWHDLETG